MLSKILNYLIIIFAGRFVVDLFLSGELAYLIHPRYSTFTLIAAVVTIIIGMIGLVLNYRKTNSEEKTRIFSIIFKLCLLGVLFYLPNYQINPLSSATFSQRSLDLNKLNVDDIGGGELSNFVRNTENISLGEWVKAINLNPNLEDYEGNKVKISGFVYKSEEVPDGLMMVSRFIVTCCAVDARPVGLLVDSDMSFEEDKWVEVAGKFEIRNIDGEDTLIIIEEEIKEIEIPEQPYII